MTAHAERILIVRPSALGDVARSVPVLASLRAAYPAARIDWLVRDVFAPAIAHHPALSNIVIFNRGEVGRAAARCNFGPLRAQLAALREPQYDLVLDLQGLARSAWMARATGAGRIVGYADARELGWLPLTQRVRVAPGAHTVDRALALVEALGVPALRDARASRLFTSEADRAWAREQCFGKRGESGGERGGEHGAEQGGKHARYVVLAPTSAWRSKEWPLARFIELAQRLLREGVSVVWTGTAGDRERCAEVIALCEAHAQQIVVSSRSLQAPTCLDLIGRTTIGQLMAVIEGGSLTIANDSAAAHFAVGFGGRLIALLGPTDPKVNAPYGRERDVLQHVQAGDEFYFRDDRSAGMMARISVQEVWDRAMENLRA